MVAVPTHLTRVQCLHIEHGCHVYTLNAATLGCSRRMSQAALTPSLPTGEQKANQLLINTCDGINLIFFLKQRG